MNTTPTLDRELTAHCPRCGARMHFWPGDSLAWALRTLNAIRLERCAAGGPHHVELAPTR